MSKERLELMRMARQERETVRTRCGRVPADISRVAVTFSREHPMLATGGAVALGVALASRKSKPNGPTSDKSSALTAMLGAFAVRLLPELLKLTAHVSPSSAGSPGATAQRN